MTKKVKFMINKGVILIYKIGIAIAEPEGKHKKGTKR